jgi:hypothetical protein
MPLPRGTRLGPYEITALVYSVMNQRTSWDIEILPVAGGSSQVFAATPAEERSARLSPDGLWMTYISNESGSFEVYVQPFPPTGASSNHAVQYAVSADGERFLVNNAADPILPITLVFNWTAALKK